MDNLSNWKATQYRFILLYAGPLIFRKVLSPIKYQHILNLHCASRILFDKKIAVKQVDEAEEITRKFVSEMPTHYGKTSQVLNNHNLIHSADDVRYMEAPLSDYSAFAFENYVRKIKGVVRSPVKVVYRRFSEIEAPEKETIKRYPLIGETEKCKICIDETMISYTKITFKKYKIGISYPNNIVQLDNGKFFQIKEIRSCNKERLDVTDFFVKGFFIKISKNVFHSPVKSEELGIVEIEIIPNTPERSFKILCMSQIKRKCILMKLKQKGYIVSMLHA